MLQNVAINLQLFISQHMFIKEHYHLDRRSHRKQHRQNFLWQMVSTFNVR